MPTPAFAFTGDTHLTRTVWVKHPDLYGDAHESFRQIIDYCIANRIPLLLLGDIFDSANPEAEDVVFFSQQMERMARQQLMVFYIKGNHDDTPVGWPSVHPWPIHIIDGTYVLGPFHVVGLDYHRFGELAPALAAVPTEYPLDFLCTHQAWAEIQRIGHTDGSLTQVHRATRVLTGDYHVNGHWDTTNAQGQSLRAWSPGSIAMQALNEPPVKFFGVVSSDRGQPVIENVTLQTRQFIDIRLTTTEMLDQFVAWVAAGGIITPGLPEVIAKPIMRVRYSTDIPEAYDRIMAACGTQFHLFDEPVATQEEMIVDAEAAPAGAFDDLLTALGQLTPPGTALYNAVRRLLESATPETEAEAIFQEFVANYGQNQEAATQQGLSGLPASAVEGPSTG